ncbi:hypothetical protein K435DRAFT_671782, partial [Dendrothele bispora CBS 962.96]
MKWNLNTHVIFSVILSVIQMNYEMLGGSLSRQEKVRKLVTQIVNLLSVKMELGSPMICFYLLNNPDHYASHKFRPFYWSNYVVEARKYWNNQETEQETLKSNDKVILIRKKGKIIGLSGVYDYIYRPKELEKISLYDWIQVCERVKIQKKKKKAVPSSDWNDNKQVVTEINKSETKNLPKNTHNFIKGHPLIDSHALKVSPDDKKLVPNFIGPGLPRRDKGDRDYYCSVM